MTGRGHVCKSHSESTGVLIYACLCGHVRACECVCVCADAYVCVRSRIRVCAHSLSIHQIKQVADQSTGTRAQNAPSPPRHIPASAFVKVFTALEKSKASVRPLSTPDLAGIHVRGTLRSQPHSSAHHWSICVLRCECK